MGTALRRKYVAVEHSENGTVTIQSRHTVDETLARLTQLLQTKSIQVFAVVDHSGEAAKAGLKMPNTKLIIFGNPKAGTPLMLARPSIAIDLPLKILISEDMNAGTWISYNSPQFLQKRHGLPAELAGVLAGV